MPTVFFFYKHIHDCKFYKCEGGPFYVGYDNLTDKFNIIQMHEKNEKLLVIVQFLLLLYCSKTCK